MARPSVISGGSCGGGAEDDQPQTSAAQHGPDPGCQFIQIERLSEIIVSAPVQPRDPVAHLVPRRQQQHRQHVSGSPHLGQQISAQTIRQHDVQHHACELAMGQGFAGIGKCCDRISGKT